MYINITIIATEFSLAKNSYKQTMKVHFTEYFSITENNRCKPENVKIKKT